MLSNTPGIHHVTTIAATAQENVDFYAYTLGMRLVCRTVNFEDILTPHLYYGDESGTPGTVLTSFPYGETDPGRVGTPQPTATAFVVPPGSLSYWRDRLEAQSVEVSEPKTRFDERVLECTDPDGTPVELVTGSSSVDPWDGGPVPANVGIRGLHGVTLTSVNPFATASVLETLGFDRVGQEDDRIRYRADGDRATIVDLHDRDVPFGREGPGTIHHVAVRVDGVDALYAWHDLFRERGYETSRVKDRHVFHSLYVREPGGILFELATESPGLPTEAADGHELYLPDHFEDDRSLIESQFPPLEVPGSSR
ncbi:VOC family protein [Natronosalvus amylolyticus]|uniref:VOC family protein n=1 Tax=Natronosalvus amylolyticus TaxID=2961994 RepID=UPI0020CA2395|nr:VOC family protein [Natronosalvus amylolyticus]